jgi:hypothetical protein
MAITRSVAKKLCTKAEYEIVDASLNAKKSKMPLYRAKQKITLTRKLRDKFTDLAKSQSREARGKSSPKRSRPAAGNEGSVQKAQLFSETLARFEDYVDYLEKEAKKLAAKKEAEKKKAAKKKLTPKKAAPKSAVKKAKKTPSSKGEKPKTGISSLQRKLEEKALKKKKTTAKKSNKSLAQKSKNAKGSMRKLKMSQNRSAVIHSHVKATGKRNQAKRDSK